MRSIGIIPAAGKSSRMGGLFKELLPVSMARDSRPVPIIHFAIHQLMNIPVSKAYVITCPSKASVHMSVLDSGIGVPVCFLNQDEPAGLGDAVLKLEPFVDNENIAFVMPDTIFTPAHAMKRLADLKEKTGASLILGLHQVSNPGSFGIVEFLKGKPLSIVDKPRRPESDWAWSSAVFDKAIFGIIKTLSLNRGEVQLTDAFSRMVELKYDVMALPFHGGKFYDIGTMNGYVNFLSEQASISRIRV